jgi:HAE1 family hydrophobic/amphiphilic exporter-1
MKLVDSSIKNPVTLTVGVVFIILFGLIALSRIPVQLTPEIQEVEIQVGTIWPGASPQEVEREIIEEQEDQLKSVEGLVEMKSESYRGRGRVIMKFQTGTDQDAALLKVSNKLNQVPQYPATAYEPVIEPTGTERDAIAWFVFRKTQGSPTDVVFEKKFIEDNVTPRLERIPGVAAVNVYGGREEEMQVIVHPSALASRNVTIRDMIRALDMENRNISAGDLDEGKRRYIVRTVGQYRTPEDIENVIIRQVNGAPVYVRDVAQVKLDYKKSEASIRQRGRPTIVMNAVREVGANILIVMEEVKKEVRASNRSLLASRNLHLDQVHDETEYIYSAIDLVRQNLFIGGSLAILVMLLFLRSGTSTLIVATAIPISIIGTFVMMAFLGRSINVISLAGMAFAVGMVVDSSIVVLENIYRHMQMGESRVAAAYKGTVEVWGAILASTLTTIAVFLPVIFVREEAGQLFRDIAVAVSCSVALSLIVSITVIPTLAARILRVPKALLLQGGRTEKLPSLSFFNLFGLALITRALSRGIAAFFPWIYRSIPLRLALVVVMTGASLSMAWFLIPKTEYLPQGNQNFLFGFLLTPPGYNVEEFNRIAEQIETDLSPYWEVEPEDENPTRLQDPRIRTFFFVSWLQQAFMGLTSNAPERVRELIPAIYRSLAKIPGLIAVVTQASLFERVGEGRSIDIQILGTCELTRLVKLGQVIFGQIRGVLPGSQARPIPSLDLGSPEIQVIPNRVRMASLGVQTSELGIAVDALMDGIKASDYWHEGTEIDLTLMGKDEYARRSQDLKDLLIHTPRGEAVTLGSLADIQLVTGPSQINHIEKKRAIVIRVNPPQEMPLEAALEKIESQIVQPIRERGELGEDCEIRLAGTADKLSLTRKALQWNFLLALVITFLLMASLFESFLYPLVIMFSVPLAAAGGFFGLSLVNRLIAFQPLDVLTMLGFIILVGIVVNNAILIVHQSLNHMKEGMEPRDAIHQSVQKRVRPIFMSTTTSIFGMMPLVLFPGAGSELYRGLGSVVIGGLAVSTVFTLFLVPTLFSLVLDAKRAIARLLR